MLRKLYSRKHHLTRTVKFGDIELTEQDRILSLIRNGKYNCVSLGDGSSIVTLDEGVFHLFFNSSGNLVDVNKL